MTPLMPCPRCTQSLPVTAEFCRRCGLSVPARSPHRVEATGGRGVLVPLLLAGTLVAVTLAAFGLWAFAPDYHGDSGAPAPTLNHTSVGSVQTLVPDAPHVVYPLTTPAAYPPSVTAAPGYTSVRDATPAYPPYAVVPNERREDRPYTRR